MTDHERCYIAAMRILGHRFNSELELRRKLASKRFERDVINETIEKLREVDLPQGVNPELGPLATAIAEIYRYRIKGDISSTDLRSLEDWVVARQLKTVPGIADVVVELRDGGVAGIKCR